MPEPACRARAWSRRGMQVAMTSFVGRRREIGAVKRLVASQRLVTLSGSGGVGKTRLAVAVAGQLISDCQDGVFIVELAGVQDASVLPHTDRKSTRLNS